ncbi:hypothetical protein WN944_016117 [Citrus x changshan-huyou]|uniref:Uncharacterized protein n=1 Tax=Citrus x changshan-huyou TaxID=2935761 RepID=A0AAP0M8S1_9ROSI
MIKCNSLICLLTKMTSRDWESNWLFLTNLGIIPSVLILKILTKLLLLKFKNLQFVSLKILKKLKKNLNSLLQLLSPSLVVFFVSGCYLWLAANHRCCCHSLQLLQPLAPCCMSLLPALPA